MIRIVTSDLYQSDFFLKSEEQIVMDKLLECEQDLLRPEPFLEQKSEQEEMWDEGFKELFPELMI